MPRAIRAALELKPKGQVLLFVLGRG